MPFELRYHPDVKAIDIPQLDAKLKKSIKHDVLAASQGLKRQNPFMAIVAWSFTGYAREMRSMSNILLRFRSGAKVDLSDLPFSGICRRGAFSWRAIKPHNLFLVSF